MTPSEPMPSDTSETADTPPRRTYEQPPSVGGLALSFFAAFFALRGLGALVARGEPLDLVAMYMPLGLTVALVVVLNISRTFRKRMGVDATEASLKRQKMAMIFSALGGAIAGAVFGVTGMNLG